MSPVETNYEHIGLPCVDKKEGEFLGMFVWLSRGSNFTTIHLLQFDFPMRALRVVT